MEYILKEMMTVAPVVEHNSTVEHKEHQERITSVAHLYEKYRTGKIEDMPRSSLAQMPDDNRSDDEMLNDDFILGLGRDELDIMKRYQELSDKLRAELDNLRLTKEKKKKYQEALAVIDNPQSSQRAKAEAYQTIEMLRNSARAT